MLIRKNVGEAVKNKSEFLDCNYKSLPMRSGLDKRTIILKFFQTRNEVSIFLRITLKFQVHQSVSFSFKSAATGGNPAWKLAQNVFPGWHIIILFFSFSFSFFLSLLLLFLFPAPAPTPLSSSSLLSPSFYWQALGRYIFSIFHFLKGLSLSYLWILWTVRRE